MELNVHWEASVQVVTARDDGLAVRGRRLARGWSQEQLATRGGTSRTWISTRCSPGSMRGRGYEAPRTGRPARWCRCLAHRRDGQPQASPLRRLHQRGRCPTTVDQPPRPGLRAPSLAPVCVPLGLAAGQRAGRGQMGTRSTSIPVWPLRADSVSEPRCRPSRCSTSRLPSSSLSTTASSTQSGCCGSTGGRLSGARGAPGPHLSARRRTIA